MKAAADRRASVRFWVLGVFVVLLSMASAFSYFGYVGQEVIGGDLLGLRGREADVALAQQRATYWWITSLFCLTGTTLTVALALPICVDAPRLPRFIARFTVASILSLGLMALIGFAAFSIITGLHGSVVH